MAKTMPFKQAPPTPSSQDERRDICLQALALAQRADKAGLSTAAYLLDMAALMVGDDVSLFEHVRKLRDGGDN